jgi:predicted phage gp36 major capsid-like protein
MHFESESSGQVIEASHDQLLAKVASVRDRLDKAHEENRRLMADLSAAVTKVFDARDDKVSRATAMSERLKIQMRLSALGAEIMEAHKELERLFKDSIPEA